VVAFLHSKGIVHGELQPDNIMLAGQLPGDPAASTSAAPGQPGHQTPVSSPLGEGLGLHLCARQQQGRRTGCC